MGPAATTLAHTPLERYIMQNTSATAHMKEQGTQIGTIHKRSLQHTTHKHSKVNKQAKFITHTLTHTAWRFPLTFAVLPWSLVYR